MQRILHPAFFNVCSSLEKGAWYGRFEHELNWDEPELERDPHKREVHAQIYYIIPSEARFLIGVHLVHIPGWCAGDHDQINGPRPLTASVQCGGATLICWPLSRPGPCTLDLAGKFECTCPHEAWALRESKTEQSKRTYSKLYKLSLMLCYTCLMYYEKCFSSLNMTKI